MSFFDKIKDVTNVNSFKYFLHTLNDEIFVVSNVNVTQQNRT